MNMSTPSSQIQNTFSPNTRIATCYNDYFAIDPNIAVKLASLDPFPATIKNSTMIFIWMIDLFVYFSINYTTLLNT